MSQTSDSTYIIIPIYNALSQTKKCINSVLKYTKDGFQLILVNDKSDYFTSQYLKKICNNHQNITLLENEQNMGFLHSANRGLTHNLEQEQPKNAFRIILNSDTIVTPN